MTDAVTENPVATEAPVTEAVVENVNTDVDTSVDDSNESQTTETTADEDYSWVPKKYMRDGKPDFQALEKARANLEKKLSQKGVTLAPETPDEYVHEWTSNLPIDEAASSAFKEEALKMGLSVDQYKFIMDKYQENVGQFVHTAERAENELKSAWGKDYADNMRLANRAFEEYVPADVSLEEIGNNPAIIKILARIGAELSEDTAPARSSVSTSLSQSEIEAMMRTPEYNQAGSDTRKKVDEWFQKKYG